MFFDRSNTGSYMAFGVNGGNSLLVTKSVDVPKVETVSSLAEKTLQEAPWLADVAPDLVAKGALIVKEGHMYLYGLSVIEIFGVFSIGLTLTFATAKFIMDLTMFRKQAK